MYVTAPSFTNLKLSKLLNDKGFKEKQCPDPKIQIEQLHAENFRDFLAEIPNSTLAVHRRFLQDNKHQRFSCKG